MGWPSRRLRPLMKSSLPGGRPVVTAPRRAAKAAAPFASGRKSWAGELWDQSGLTGHKPNARRYLSARDHGQIGARIAGRLLQAPRDALCACAHGHFLLTILGLAISKRVRYMFPLPVMSYVRLTLPLRLEIVKNTARPLRSGPPREPARKIIAGVCLELRLASGRLGGAKIPHKIPKRSNEVRTGQDRTNRTVFLGQRPVSCLSQSQAQKSAAFSGK